LDRGAYCNHHPVWRDFQITCQRATDGAVEEVGCGAIPYDSGISDHRQLFVFASIYRQMAKEKNFAGEDLMKIIRTFETPEIPNPHFISARALHVGDSAQFENLSLEAGQEQKKHVAYTNVYLYVLEGSGILEAGDETISLSTDMLVERKD
jgi:mannose-6-phosphate isomerase-like protein (cupin superfamily)